MREFNRRTYLKGAMVSASVLAGVSAASALTPPDGQSGSQPKFKDRSCPGGTTPLAKYVAEDTDHDGEDEFTFTEGDDVVTFTDVDRNDEGEIVAFDWTSSMAVAVVSVKFGPVLEQFEGGFIGEVDLTDADHTISHVTFCAPRGGRAVLCELDMNAAYDTEMHLDGDPAGGGRDGVVHVTGTTTSDYGHSMVNVLSQLGQRLTLDELDAVTFDFYEATANEGPIPDELFVTLLTSNDDLKLAVRHVDSTMASSAWDSFDVLAAMSQQWDVEDINITDLRTSTSAVNTAQDLRDTPDEQVALTSAYGDAVLAGVGFGAGNTRNTTTIDRYFDDLVVEWEGNTATFDFPAVVPMTVDDVEERGNTFTVELTFQQSEMGLSLDDVASKSVTLNAFGQFAPPIEMGAVARSVDAKKGTLEAKFRTDDVDAVLGSDDRFIVSGDFDVTNGTAFFGVGTR